MIVAFPLRLKITEVFAEEEALKVAVSVTVPPFSARLAPDFERLTVGAASSSMMLTVCCCVPFSLAPSPPETAEISTIICSPSSLKASLTPVRVAVPVIAPALIVILSDSV